MSRHKITPYYIAGMSSCGHQHKNAVRAYNCGGGRQSVYRVTVTDAGTVHGDRVIGNTIRTITLGSIR